MKTFYDIIKDVSNLRWSIIDPEPESFAEVMKAVKLAIPQAHSYIWGLEDFPFKKKRAAIMVKAGTGTVLSPKGNILSVLVEGEHAYLQSVDGIDLELMKPQSGTPLRYAVEFTDFGAAIQLYPTPNKDITLIIRYETNLKAKDANGSEKHNLTDNTDICNLPNDAMIEDLYLHCLYTKSMVYLIADESDENYVPYQREFEEAYQTLLGLTGIKREPRLII